jgi:hypothetical protein
MANKDYKSTLAAYGFKDKLVTVLTSATPGIEFGFKLSPDA